jgi:hypothetical protein
MLAVVAHEISNENISIWKSGFGNIARIDRRLRSYAQLPRFHYLDNQVMLL